MSSAALARRLARQAAAGLGRRARSSDTAGCPFHRGGAALEPATNRSAGAEQASWSGAEPYVSKGPARRPFTSLPSPKGLPVLGTAVDVLRAGGAPKIHEYCDRRHRELGPIYRETLGSVDAVFVADSALIQKVYTNEGKFPMHMVPEAWLIYNEVKGIQRGLFFMDGPEWIDRRRSLNNVFLKTKTVTDNVPVFNDVITDLLNRWHDARNDRGILENVERELYNWSIESLGAMIFGRRLGCIAQTSSMDNVHEFVHCVQQIFNESAKMSMFSPRLAYRLRLPVWRRFVRAAGRALELARDYVEENVKAIAKDPSSAARHNQGILSQLLLNEKISEEELVRIVTDLFLAAADTTSHATQWALYLLAKHPEQQERLLHSVRSVVPAGQPITEESLARLPYVKAVIREALRLYPVAPFLTRILSEDIVLDGYHIPAGKLILMSLYTTGRDEQHFSEPHAFRPERWLRDRDRMGQVNSWACLPFGLGARSCIGRRVAEVQMQFLIARTVQKFELTPSTDKDVQIKMRLITTPEEPISLRMTPR
ncbi:cytochrome P450 315a1, mitochondrial [Dermacentor albipictus]|uniref:cytochrome P450 315a1, mitochondrial n=1 Tax=Dermacentor albipictus TaxID=60249 RepID=UPI0031FD497D